jgi:hypothetical protein
MVDVFSMPSIEASITEEELPFRVLGDKVNGPLPKGDEQGDYISVEQEL